MANSGLEEEWERPDRFSLPVGAAQSCEVFQPVSWIGYDGARSVVGRWPCRQPKMDWSEPGGTLLVRISGYERGGSGPVRPGRQDRLVYVVNERWSRAFRATAGNREIRNAI